jgi:hypothetical protein
LTFTYINVTLTTTSHPYVRIPESSHPEWTKGITNISWITCDSKSREWLTLVQLVQLMTLCQIVQSHHLHIHIYHYIRENSRFVNVKIIYSIAGSVNVWVSRTRDKLWILYEEFRPTHIKYVKKLDIILDKSIVCDSTKTSSPTKLCSVNIHFLAQHPDFIVLQTRFIITLVNKRNHDKK